MKHRQDQEAPAALRWPDGLDATRFMNEFWQQRPLWMPGALAGFADPVTPEELAGLALDQDIESRLLRGGGGGERDGPFTEEDFLGLDERDWTLLVQRVDQALPAVAGLLAPFRFIPNWRLDDVMVSYATPGGDVGAHVDNYDVFLVQGCGRRRWSIDRDPVPQDSPADDVEFERPAGFRGEESRELEAGDVLYLPPRVAHHGVALQPCLTYSVGFRAPSHGELLAGYLSDRIEEASRQRLVDPRRPPATASGEITAADLERVAAVLRGELAAAGMARWFGRFVTRPAVDPVEPGAPPEAAELRRGVRAGRVLQRSSPAHFAFVRDERGCLLFAGGEAHRCDGSLEDAAALLSGGELLAGEWLADRLERPEFATLVTLLVERGLLYLDDRA